MKNLWKNLPDKSPYVLEEDKKFIDEFNAKAEDKYKIVLDLLPEPFIGNKDADIVLLNLNPGVDKKDKELHKQINYVDAIRKNLIHEQAEYPFYFLNPEFEKTPGYKWWKRKLNQLRKDVEPKKLSSKVLCVEYFPYHSKNYKAMKKIYSQEYGFYLVEQAIKRKATIIILRAEKRWREAVPELKKYDYYFLKNPQSSTINPENIYKIKKTNFYQEILKKDVDYKKFKE